MRGILGLIAVVIPIVGGAQIEEWVARYNGPGNDYDWARAIAVDESGNVYVTGRSYGSDTIPDYATIKYNTSGAEQWVARYNGPGNDRDDARAIAVDGNGNVYVTGESGSSGTDDDYATVKYNASGTEQWVARYNGPGNRMDCANAIAIDASGNVYVTGHSADLSWSSDYATIKYNSSGDSLWVARYNGLGNGDYANAIAIDNSGNVYVTGRSEGSGTEEDYATIKYNSSGAEQWVARYNGPSNYGDYANAIAVDASGNVYVTGWSMGSETSADYDDYATVKYNSSGAEQWVARYNGPCNGGDGTFAIAVDDNHVYVTGGSEGSGTDNDYVTIKYSQAGIEEKIIPEKQNTELSNYPNPFHSTTSIQYAVAKPTTVNLRIYNVAGQVVKTLISKSQKPGHYTMQWNGRDDNGQRVAPGVYFYRLETEQFKDTKKLVLLR